MLKVFAANPQYSFLFIGNIFQFLITSFETLLLIHLFFGLLLVPVVSRWSSSFPAKRIIDLRFINWSPAHHFQRKE